MLVIKNISAKNFLSIGNVSQSINFNRQELVLILGENLDLGGSETGSRNGVGKSVLVNALSYALFGQSLSNIKKENLINKSNGKNMLVTLEFSINNVEYKIERGRRPNCLRFYENGVTKKDVAELDNTDDDAQGDSRETQKDINKLLGMTHDMFRHIVALNTYTEPFLNMRVNDQREIIEQLLGITLLSEKAEKLKELNKLSKDAINVESITIKAIQTANKKIDEQIASLQMRKKMWLKKKNEDITELTSALDELNTIDIVVELENHKLLDIYQTKIDKKGTLESRLKQLVLQTTQQEKIIAKIVIELDSLKNKVCNACGQALIKVDHKQLIADKSEELENEKNKLLSLTSDKEVIHRSLSEYSNLGLQPSTFYKDINDAYNHKNEFNLLEQQLTSRTNELDPYTDQIYDMEHKALQDVNYDKLNELTKVLEHQEFLLKLLTSKDSFIRKKIIDQNLSYLNTRLSHYLDLLGLPHNVTFLNDLSVSITELGKDFDFQSLSRGEMTRVILSLSWAFRDVWENLYQPINILIVDELVDGGTDAAGVESTMSILKSFSRDRKKSIWLISHRDELINRVDSILNVYKENGFTNYEIVD